MYYTREVQQQGGAIQKCKSVKYITRFQQKQASNQCILNNRLVETSNISTTPEKEIMSQPQPIYNEQTQCQSMPKQPISKSTLQTQ